MNRVKFDLQYISNSTWNCLLNYPIIELKNSPTTTTGFICQFDISNIFANFWSIIKSFMIHRRKAIIPLTDILTFKL